jgi:hypothetical protein
MARTNISSKLSAGNQHPIHARMDILADGSSISSTVNFDDMPAWPTAEISDVHSDNVRARPHSNNGKLLTAAMQAS